MNRIISICIFTLLCYCNLFAQWEIINNRTFPRINDADFVSEKNGWIAYSNYGKGNVISKTEDGGETWITLFPESEETGWAEVTSIDFYDENIGWAILHREQSYWVLKTTDGGNSWAIQKSTDDYAYDIFALNELIVFFSAKNKIFKSSDSGENWIELTSCNLYQIDEIFFISQSVGFVTGIKRAQNNYTQEILRTIDGGNNWSIITGPSEGEWFHGIELVNDSTGYLATDSKLFKTTDTCNTFTEIFNIPKSENMLYPPSLTFDVLSDTTIYVITNDTTNTFILFHSNDRGSNWEIKCSVDYAIPTQIIFPNNSTGYIFGEYCIGRAPEGALILKTNDYGDSWKTKSLEIPFTGVSFITEDIGIACGVVTIVHTPTLGNLFITGDGGKSWELKLKTESLFRKCLFFDNNSGIALTEKMFFKTTDGCESWIKTFDSGTEDDNRFIDFYFPEKNNGWLTGIKYTNNDSSSIILSTKDGGVNWQTEFENDPGGLLNSLYFLNEASGWAVGEKINSNGSISGLVLKYSSKYGWIEQPLETNLPLNKVFFVTEEIGFILGGFINEDYINPLFLRTVDGGKNWEELNGLNYLLHDIYVEKNGIGFAVGEHGDAWNGIGVILSTADNGKNWHVETDSLNSSLYTLNVKEEFAVAAGNRGIIVRTTNSGTTWVDENNEIVVSNFNLSQNYPNPFNPTTVIEYSIPVNSRQYAVGSLPTGQAGKKKTDDGEQNSENRIQNQTFSNQHPESIIQHQVSVSLKVYDILGKEVATLVNEQQRPGNYEVKWDATSLSSGVYFYKLSAGEYSETRKMILLR